MKKKLLIAFLILLLVPVAIYFCFPEVLYNYSITSVRKAAGLSKKVIEVDNYSIHYLEGGQGETILLLHGFSANKDNWPKISYALRPWMRSFSRRWLSLASWRSSVVSFSL